MQQVIELSVETADGIADCRIERESREDRLSWSVVILYPHTTNGIATSKVYEYGLVVKPATNTYCFSKETAIHPKVKPLEEQLSDAILKASK